MPNAMSRFRIEEFRVVIGVGSGYQITTTTFNFSPNGAYQSAVGSGQILIQSRADGSTIAQFHGGAARGATAVSFTPNSAAIAAWDGDSNRTTLWRIADQASAHAISRCGSGRRRKRNSIYSGWRTSRHQRLLCLSD